MPYLRKIAKKIETIKEKNDEVKTALDNNEEWKKYVEGDLQEANKREAEPICVDPRGPQQPIEEEEES